MSNFKRTDQDLLRLMVNDALFTLHPYRAVFWELQSTLIVTDLHLGKIQHFRNSGIYLPKHAAFDNYERLSSLLLEFAPKSLLILGDLFHSHYNLDWVNFCELRNSFHSIDFQLVPGNHDIVGRDLFLRNNVSIHESGYLLEGFFFSHYPDDRVEAYNIAGHIHPGIRLVGDGLQSLKLPAFYFGDRQGLLPSFGTFTGISIINPKPGDQVVVISDETLVYIQTNQ
jgi:DNA ligase-associated metallophosphoesterase